MAERPDIIIDPDQRHQQLVERGHVVNGDSPLLDRFLDFGDRLFDSISSADWALPAFSMAVLFWNCSELFGSDAHEKLAGILYALSDGNMNLVRYRLRDFREMCIRKRQHYPDGNPLIIDFDLVECGNGYTVELVTLSG